MAKTTRRNVEALQTLFDEMCGICRILETEDESEDPQHWSATLFTEFDDGLCKINNVLTSLQLMVQRGDIK